MEDMYAVYRVLRNGLLIYAPRSATSNKKLAEEIAAELSAGEVTMPDGTMKKIPAYPHIAKLISTTGYEPSKEDLDTLVEELTPKGNEQ